MRLLENLLVDHQALDRRIEIYEGDLMDLPQKVDALIVSAFPGDYTPTATSVIGALKERGIDVAALATDKMHDLRHDFSCWISQRLTGEGGKFDYILCFESTDRLPPSSKESRVAPPDKPGERVQDIFRALAPFIGAEPNIRSVAMPLVACGDQRQPVAAIAEPLLNAATQWLRSSPLKQVLIVERNQQRARELETVASLVRARLTKQQNVPEKKYDVFLSYSTKKPQAADAVCKELRALRPSIRIYRDSEKLKEGRDYRVQLDRALRESRRFVPLLSPEYVVSLSCKDEFNTAWNLREVADEEFFFPLLIYETPLTDPRMGKLHFRDCVDLDVAKMREACSRLVAQLFTDQRNAESLPREVSDRYKQTPRATRPDTPGY